MALRSSESTTSLTQLNEACLFCYEGNNPEEGDVLCPSKALIPCKCEYKVHLSCWSKYLDKGARVCPQCKLPLMPAGLVANALADHQVKDTGVSAPWVKWMLLVIFLCVIAFVIGMLVSFKK